jgi:hypothetical protein
MPAWLGALSGGLGSALGSYLQYKGAKDQNKLNAAALKYTERARQESKDTLGSPSIFETSEWLFPGLLTPPGGAGVSNLTLSKKGGGGMMTPTALPEPSTGGGGGGGTAFDKISLFGGKEIPFRAEGGPVETGEDYVVGEEGPEVFQPTQDGTVIPNPNTAMPGQGMEGGMPGMEGGMEGGMDPIIQALAQAIAQAIAEVLGGGGGASSEAMPPGPEGMPSGGEGLPGMQYGGPVQAGRRYQVGEQGAEGFMPNQRQQPAMSQPGPVTPGIAGSSPRPGEFGSLGEGAVQRSEQLMGQPGEMSSTVFEREQEQAGQGFRGQMQAITGDLTGRGVDPNSPMGQSMGQSAALQHGQQRAESARDYGLAQEVLYSEDIQAATANYLNFLNTIFGLQQQRAAAAGGQGFPQAQAVNAYDPLARGAAGAGFGLAQYFDQQSQQNQGGGGGEEPS